MSLFEILAVLITLSALFSYVNYRYFRLPTTIGVMLIALVFSLVLILASYVGWELERLAEDLLMQIDFNQALLHGMLSFLLFAGALHVNLGDLAEQKWIISALATVGVLGCTGLIGLLSWTLFNWLGLEVRWIDCLLFGALISPTDPIAVMGILRRSTIPRSLVTKITGESLFNDGVAVVVFLVLLDVTTSPHGARFDRVLGLLVLETGGGILFGLLIGWLAYLMLKSVDQYQVEVLVTLALVTGGYALAEWLHLSAPISIVVAGLLIGNYGRLLAMSARTCGHLDTFWELVDEILNAVLFLLIGLEILVLQISSQHLLAGLLAIPLVLSSRWVWVSALVLLLRRFRTFSPGAIRILTWGGLRGGISVALALSLPVGPARQIFLPVTYLVVVFSVLVQGLTIGKVVQRASKS